MKAPKTPGHALKESIKKYEKLLEKTQNDVPVSQWDVSGQTCACCAYDDAHPLFEGGEEIDCGNCLVAEYAGEAECRGTPWAILYEYLCEGGGPLTAELVQCELSFLRRVEKANQ